jgi:hypothetical protein
LKDISLLGTDNLTFSNITSKPETDKPVLHLATTSRQAGISKHSFAMFYPYPYQELEVCNTTCCLLGFSFSGISN